MLRKSKPSLILLLAALLSSGCTKEVIHVVSVSCTVDGKATSFSAEGWAHYDSINHFTNIYFGGGMEILFKGDTVGTQNLGDTIPLRYSSNPYYVQIYLGLRAKDGFEDGYLYDNTHPSPGNITITKYGIVGDSIIGTFSGTLTNIVDSSTAHITDGRFSAWHAPDDYRGRHNIY